MQKALPVQLEALKKETNRYLADLVQRICKPESATTEPELAKVESKPEAKQENKPVNESGSLEFVTPVAAKVVEKKINLSDFFAKLPVDVMAEFQRKAHEITGKVQQELAANFIKVLEPPEKSTKKSNVNKDLLDGLTLVNDEDLVLRIVTDQISKQLNEKYIISIALLCLRIEKLLGFEIDLFLNPVSPISLCSALENTMQYLAINNLQKKYLLTALEKSLAVEYRTFIQTLNNLLIADGVLPKLTDKEGKERSEKYLQKLKAEKEAEEAGDGKGDGDGDKDGKGDGEGSVFMQKIVVPEGSAHAIVSNPDAPIIPQAQLIQNFNSMNNVLASTDAESGYLKPVETESTFSELLNSNTDISQFGLSSSSSKTISIMSMIFEALSNDRNMSGPIKGLLFQLVIPLLKAAIEDEDFFEDSANPAQILFNTISEAGMSWSQESNIKSDFLYQKMSAIVQKVTTEYDDDKNVFEDAIADLNSFVDVEKERAIKIEERMVSAESSKARLVEAKNVSVSHIEDVFSGENLPDTLRKFIDERWQPVLFYIYNKYEDVNCGEWHEAVHLEWKIINSLHGDEEITIEEIMLELTQKLEIIGMNSEEYKEELESIRPFLRGVPDSQRAENTDESIQHTEKLLEQAQEALNEIDAAIVVDQESEQKTNQEVGREDATVAPKVDSAEIETENLEALVDIEILNSINIGSWIEDKQQEPPVKIKLAAYIKYTDTYVLVNRKGAKYKSLVSADFAKKFKDNEFRLVESTLSFDRAMESIIGKLRPENEAA